ncbi:MAG TPA: hypothetical protein VJ203_14540 [Bacteroidales bacterium]|nr:hypothetical protein [Bacteroidales bacterium]
MPDQHTYPYRYRAFSLNIMSGFPVTGLEPAPVTLPDVTLVEGKVPEALDHPVNSGVLYESNEHEFLLRVEQVARYHVRNGNEIVVERLENRKTWNEISAFITGTAFGALLHQRRLLPLHASTVQFKGQCLVFAGISGAGKSTLAASLIKQGATLVADDISVVDFTGEEPAVCPAFPTIRIWEDSLKHLGVSTGKLDQVRDELKKYYLPVTQFSREHAVIDRIFILHSHNKPELELKEITGVDKFRLLKKHTYLFRGIPKTGLEQNHFVLANKLANRVPVTMLTRSNGDFNTGRIITALADYIDNRQHGRS